MTIMSAGECDLWNNGIYTQCQFGPTGKGNNLGIYDESLAIWKMVEHPGIDTIDIDHCIVDTGSGPVANQALQVGSTYVVSNRLNPSTGNIDTMFTPLSLGYDRANADSGIMCAPGSRKWRVTGLCYRHATYGVQGQANSEYLIGRHDLWTIGLRSVPASTATMVVGGVTITNVVPADNEWHAVGAPLDFVTWADRIPSPAIGIYTVFGSWVGQSLQVAIGQSLAEAAGNPSASRCNDTSAPHNIGNSYTVTGGQSDGFVSLQTYARCNGGNGHYMRIGYAYNSTLGNGIWF